MNELVPTIVVFGLDPDGNPRAAKFTQGSTQLAIKAASLLGYEVARISDAIAARLAEGNVFARGTRFIGRVRRPLFDSIVALADGTKTSVPEQSRGRRCSDDR